MIPRKRTTLQLPTWQNNLANAIKDPEQLLTALDLPVHHLSSLNSAHKLFPLRVTQSYLDRMEKGNINDPLLRQILPWEDETSAHPDYSLDPVGDKHSEVVPGLLHKYKHRVLLTLTSACGIHCRYCFRRHFDYSASNSLKNWQECLTYIQSHDNITEVILSGGDPLSLSDHRLSAIVGELNRIPHLTTLRIHTRQVIVLPDRVDSALLSWIKNSPLNIVLVVHVNHPNEIDRQVKQAMSELRYNNVTLLNQSVLLKGINDNSEILIELSRKLFDASIMPYYLHMLDRVQGAAHFDVMESLARQLIIEMQKELPGYLVPKLVKEISNKPNKIPVA